MAGLLSRLFGRTHTVETRASFGDGWDGLANMSALGGGSYATNPFMAENVATVLACIQAIASGLASLPPRVYRAEGAGRVEVGDHPVAALLRRPGPHQTWPELIEWLMGQVLGWGNGLLAIEVDAAGRPVALHPIPWAGVSPVRLPSGRLAFDVPPRRYLETEVLHLKDRTDDGLIGRSRLARAPAVVQGAVQVQRYSTNVWDNGATPSGIVTISTTTGSGSKGEENLKRFKAQFRNDHTGTCNAGRVFFGDAGTEYTPFSISPESAQTLASRRFSGEEVARIFGVPPAVVGDLTHGSFTNSETAGRWFAQFTLAAWVRKIEAAMARTLFDASGQYHVELDMSALLRGNDSERWASYKIAVDAGILDVNEIRALEGWNPRPAAKESTPIVA